MTAKKAGPKTQTESDGAHELKDVQPEAQQDGSGLMDPPADLSGNQGVGPVAVDEVSAHDAEVQAIVEQALAEQKEIHDEELREITEVARTPDVPGKPLTRPLSLGSSKRIKVMATMLGYYNHKRQRPGDVFWIKDQQAFSTKWMSKVPITTPERTTGASAALRAETGRIRRESAPAVAVDAPTGGADVMTKP